MTPKNTHYSLQFPETLLDFATWVPKIKGLGLLGFHQYSGAQSVVFVFDDYQQRTIRAFSEMHDYEERGEAGQICFEILDDDVFNASNIDYYIEIERPTSLEKLVLRRNGFRFDSGLRFKLNNGAHFYLIASSAPYLLSTIGLDSSIETTTEFAINDYDQQVIFKI